MTDDLLDVARLESHKLSLERSPLDLRAVVDASIERGRMLKPPMEIRLENWKSPLLVSGDEQRLIQVLFNILENASKYASNGENVVVKVYRENDSAIAMVKDFGPGLTEPEQKAIFTPFYQAHPGGRLSPTGLGLGLFIAGQIVEQHGGRVEVESEPGDGAT